MPPPRRSIGPYNGVYIKFDANLPTHPIIVTPKENTQKSTLSLPSLTTRMTRKQVYTRSLPICQQLLRSFVRRESDTFHISLTMILK